MHPSLACYPVVITVPVLWGDQDSFRHVNNVVYLRWCETARIDYLTRVGLVQMVEREGVGPIVASIRCDFRLPVEYPDEVQIGARVARIGNTSLRMDHVVVSSRYNAVAADVSSTLVVYDYKAGSPTRAPDRLREAIAALEGQTAPGS
jgi:acyl-CoA thioester hydrolase